MSSDIDFSGAIGAIAELIKAIAKASGETTEQVSARVNADIKAKAASPSDETDPVAEEIDKHTSER